MEVVNVQCDVVEEAVDVQYVAVVEEVVVNVQYDVVVVDVQYVVVVVVDVRYVVVVVVEEPGSTGVLVTWTFR